MDGRIWPRGGAIGKFMVHKPSKRAAGLNPDQCGYSWWVSMFVSRMRGEPQSIRLGQGELSPTPWRQLDRAQDWENDNVSIIIWRAETEWASSIDPIPER